MVQPGTTTTGYDYDAHDNPAGVTDAENHVTTFVHDDLGHRTKRTSPDTGITTYEYDPAGNVIRTIDSDSTEITYHYDAVNQLAAVDFPGQPNAETFEYSAGRLSTMHDPAGATFFVFGPLGRITEEQRTTDTYTVVTTYLYDSATGDLSGMDYPTSTQVRYGRDSLGRITSMTVDGVSLFTSASYLPFGPMKEISGQICSISRTFDQRYQVTRIQGPGLDYQYSRDSESRVVSISGITPPSLAPLAASYSYQSGTSRLATAGEESVITSNSGNITSDSVFTYTYDGLHRLIQVNQGNTLVAQYSYDGLDRRVKKSAGGQTTYDYYDLLGNLRFSGPVL